MHQTTPILGVSFTIIIRFKLLNIVIVVLKLKSEGQTSKQTYKQTNKQTREPLSKGDSCTGLIEFHIQPSLATLASLTHFIYFILLNSAIITKIPAYIWHFDPILRHWLCLGKKQVTMETRGGIWKLC